jgi:hypothetical protein
MLFRCCLISLSILLSLVYHPAVNANDGEAATGLPFPLGQLLGPELTEEGTCYYLYLSRAPDASRRARVCSFLVDD